MVVFLRFVLVSSVVVAGCGGAAPVPVTPEQGAVAASPTPESAEAEVTVPPRTFAPILMAEGRAFALLEELIIDGLPTPTETLQEDDLTLVLARSNAEADSGAQVVITDRGGICRTTGIAAHLVMIPGRASAYQALELDATSLGPCSAERPVLVAEGANEVVWFRAHRESDPGAAVSAPIEGELDGSLMTYVITTPASDDMLCPGTPAQITIWEGAVQHGSVTIPGRLINLRGLVQIDGERYLFVEWGDGPFQIVRVSDGAGSAQQWPITSGEMCDCCD